MEGMQGALAHGRSSPEGRAAPDEFPAGLRVLVVDDDVTCLRILERILQRCRYRVTICCQATIALSLLRERKGGYDVVISDVHMPDMDGFRLLELVGLEMDLPVIMMSADGRTSAVMKGIKHGACDYLIKPVRMEELKNIWQHVIRKKWNGNREVEYSGSMEDSDHHHRVIDDADYASSVNDVAEGTRKSQKKKRDAKEDEDDGELDNEDPSTSKKSRVVWSVELHQQFVNAVNKIGIEKAVPKRILELMNVPGLTRENVASHLQKFRLYLKRISGVAQHHGGFPNSFLRPEESNATVGPLGRLDFQALVASGQIPQQTLAALHEELLGRPSSGLVLPAIDMPVKGSNCTASEPGVVFGQTLVKCPSNISELLPQNIAVGNMSSGSSLWSSDHLSTTCTTRGITSTLNSDLVKMLQQQQPRTVSAEPHHAIKVQPSSVVVPSSSSDSFQIGDNSALLNHNPLVITSRKSSGIQMGMNPVPSIQNSNLNNIREVEHCIHLSSQTNNVPLGGAKASNGVLKNVGVLDRYATPGPLSSSGSSFSACIDASTSWEAHNSTLSVGPASGLTCHLPNLCNLASEANTGTLPTQGHGRYLGFVGRGTRIPSRFAIDDIESPTKTMNHMKTYMGGDGDRVKQELHLDFTDRSKFGNTAATFFCK